MGAFENIGYLDWRSTCGIVNWAKLGGNNIIENQRLINVLKQAQFRGGWAKNYQKCLHTANRARPGFADRAQNDSGVELR